MGERGGLYIHGQGKVGGAMGLTDCSLCSSALRSVKSCVTSSSLEEREEKGEGGGRGRGRDGREGRNEGGAEGRGEGQRGGERRDNSNQAQNPCDKRCIRCQIISGEAENSISMDKVTCP